MTVVAEAGEGDFVVSAGGPVGVAVGEPVGLAPEGEAEEVVDRLEDADGVAAPVASADPADPSGFADGPAPTQPAAHRPIVKARTAPSVDLRTSIGRQTVSDLIEFR